MLHKLPRAAARGITRDQIEARNIISHRNMLLIGTMYGNSLYLERLFEDMRQLGLAQGNWQAYGSQTREKADYVLRRTRSIGNIPLCNPDYEAVTTTGRRIRQLMAGTVRFSLGASSLGFCSDAEHNLALTVRGKHSAKYPSTIVTQEGRPIAIIKSVGEPTMFGLVDVPDYGVLADSLIDPGLRFDRRALSAYDSGVVGVDIEYFGQVHPDRLSLFSIPDAERKAFTDDTDRLSLDLPRAAIQAWAASALGNALCLTTEQMCENQGTMLV